MSGLSFVERPGSELSIEHGQTISAQGFSLGGEITPGPGINLELNWIHKDYDSYSFRSTDNGLAQATWRLYDTLTAQFRLERRHEVTNIAGILSDIQSNTATLGAEITPTSRLRFNIDGSFSRFDDANNGYRSFLVGGYELTRHPEIVRIAGVHEYRDTTRQGFIVSDGLGSKTSFIHLYWTPNDYHLGGVLLEWPQDYSTDKACGAAKNLFSAKLMVKNDTNLNPGLQVVVSLEDRYSPTPKSPLNGHDS